MGVDYILDQRNEIFRYEIKPAGTSAVVDGSIEIIIGPTDVDIWVDHGQQLNEPRGFIVIIVDDSNSFPWWKTIKKKE